MKNSESRPFLHRAVRMLRPWFFTFGVLALYALGALYSPDKALHALHEAVTIFKQLGPPMCFALLMMVLVNRFLTPTAANRFLGQGTGLKGVLLSSLAGILSMGPIYAWYPIFKSLKDNGVSTFITANFMGCRAVKPVLYPVLIGYFGWEYALMFACLSLIGAWTTAWITAAACPNETEAADDPSARS